MIKFGSIHIDIVFSTCVDLKKRASSVSANLLITVPSAILPAQVQNSTQQGFEASGITVLDIQVAKVNSSSSTGSGFATTYLASTVASTSNISFFSAATSMTPYSVPKMFFFVLSIIFMYFYC